MTKLFIKIATLSIVLILFATSCTKTGATGPAGPAGSSSLTGNFEGVVFLWDVAGNKLLSPTLLTGDTVTLTNNSSGATYKTTTSTTGTYTFSNISAGTYSLTVSKSGYGIVKAYGIQFVGGGTTYRNFNLAQIPTTSVATATAIAGGNVQVSGTVPASAYTQVIIYLSLPSNTFVNNTLGNFSTYTYVIYIGTGTTFSFNFTPTALYDLGFVSGNTVYFAAYTVNNNGSWYTDPVTGLNVYTAISSSPVTTSITVP